DAATSRGCSAFLDGHAAAELALGDQLAIRAVADLARDEEQITAADERNIVRHRSRRLGQGDALCRQILFNRTRHGYPRLVMKAVRPDRRPCLAQRLDTCKPMTPRVSMPHLEADSQRASRLSACDCTFT